ncbi:hypothetical protein YASMINEVIRUS_1298 [Yasminevirus sp. GU-2018]|uniref:Uncharacterized protein n=1 Tax=Yasminevirus sp. GU-2018 TaxID=2420051 RepID=A0A5K0UBZ9_9VIRU|nr:hypothetical protein YASMINEVIRUS_1298 [Yasminevirus sp. GU-2018]
MIAKNLKLLILICVVSCYVVSGYPMGGTQSKESNEPKRVQYTELISPPDHFLEVGKKERLMVNATLYNHLDVVMQFLECNVSLGRIDTEMNDYVMVGDYQVFEIHNTMSTPMIVSGNCYYFVEFDLNSVRKSLIIDVIFFRNLKTGHEFYGLTSDYRYDVHILITRPGVVQYILWM